MKNIRMCMAAFDRGVLDQKLANLIASLPDKGKEPIQADDFSQDAYNLLAANAVYEEFYKDQS
jgi:hypothetical protein